MGLLPCRCVVVPAPGAAAGGVPAERCVGRLHLRHLLLCLAQPAPRASREPPLLDIALPCCFMIMRPFLASCTGSTSPNSRLGTEDCYDFKMEAPFLLMSFAGMCCHILLHASGLYARHILCVGSLHAMALWF